MSTEILRTILAAFTRWDNAQTSFAQQLALRDFKQLMKQLKENLREEEPKK